MRYLAKTGEPASAGFPFPNKFKDTNKSEEKRKWEI